MSGPFWPADRVERRPIAELIPYARNALHSHGYDVELTGFTGGDLAMLLAAMARGWCLPWIEPDAGKPWPIQRARRARVAI